MIAKPRPMLALMTLILAALLSAPALASPGSDLESQPIRLAVPQHLRAPSGVVNAADSDGETKKERERFYQLEARYRILSVPDSVMGVFYQQHEHVTGTAIAVAYTTVKKSGFHLIITVDYSQVTADDGPWQEKGTNKDIDWTEINLFFASGDISAGYELRLPGPFTILFAAGIGVGYVGGDIVSYDSPTGPTGLRSEQSHPSVFPVLNLQFSPRVVLFNKLVIGVDVGMRNVLYGGLTAGLRF